MSLPTLQPAERPADRDAAATAVGDAAAPAGLMRPGPERLMQAIERLVGGGRLRARRFLEHVRERGTPLDNLWCAIDARGEIVASGLSVPSPGRTAMLFVSSSTDATHAQCVAIADQLCAESRRRGAALAQALIPESAVSERSVLHGAGFRDLTVLISMERPLPRRGDIGAAALPAGATIEHWDPTDRRTLIAVLDASYEETLDCPGLCGLRRTEDILDGHLHSGRLEPTLWSILRVDGEAVGAILLGASGPDAVELIYLGLAKRARGRRLGQALLRRSLATLVGRPERVVSLAVDRANEPARRLYRSLGFRPVHERMALIRPLEPSIAS